MTMRIQNNQWSLEHCSVLCIVQIEALFAEKCDHLPPPPPTHTFLKRLFLTDFKKYTHTPFKVTKFWRIGRKVHKTEEKCQNPPCWRTTNEAERYAFLPNMGLPKHGNPVFPHFWAFFGTIVFPGSNPTENVDRSFLCAGCRNAQYGCQSVVAGTPCALVFWGVCWAVGHPFVVMKGQGWLMSATCVPWYVLRGNTGLVQKKTATPTFGP